MKLPKAKRKPRKVKPSKVRAEKYAYYFSVYRGHYGFEVNKVREEFTPYDDERFAAGNYFLNFDDALCYRDERELDYNIAHAVLTQEQIVEMEREKEREKEREFVRALLDKPVINED